MNGWRSNKGCTDVGKPMRSMLLAAVATGCLLIGSVAAQPAPPRSAAPTPSSPLPAAQVPDASLGRSALKATTFKVGTTVTNLVVLTLAAGGLGGGAILTGVITASSWALYTLNDYVWDSFEPPPTKQTADQSFDATAEMWMTTKKFLTYKPVIASVKLASIYAYTGSPSTTLVFGTASILTNTVVFYANNVAWDWYDWYAASPPAMAVAHR
jgi:uncharacterized membrane protein